MFKEILIGILIGACFLVFLYYASQVAMQGWLKALENYLLNKSKKKQNEKKEKK